MSDSGTVRADIARILRTEGGLSDVESVRVAEIVERHMRKLCRRKERDGLQRLRGTSHQREPE